MHFGKHLKKVSEEKGFTPKELSILVGVAHTSVNRDFRKEALMTSRVQLYLDAMLLDWGDLFDV